MDYYKMILGALERYFNNRTWRKLFLEGGCYWLADILQKGIPDSYIMINRAEEHCGVCFGNGLYDVSGKISAKFFRRAEERDISFMRKNYQPKFDKEGLEQYLKMSLLL